MDSTDPAVGQGRAQGGLTIGNLALNSDEKGQLHGHQRGNGHYPVLPFPGRAGEHSCVACALYWLKSEEGFSVGRVSPEERALL
jgi:hypothetical protein